jgi:hypothetical protein
MKGITIVPIEFFENSTNPKNPHLFEAVQKYCEREFGSKVGLDKNLRNWAVVSEDDSGYVIHGLTSLRFMLDCPTFHVTAAEDKEGRELARKVRDMLMNRAAAFLQDQFGVGTRIQVHVAPTAERFWRGFLRLIGAKPANRWEVQV